MKFGVLFALACSFAFSSCGTFMKPAGWPVETSADPAACRHMIEHTKFTGSAADLTPAEKGLLTFLNNPDNIAAAVGEKNRPGSHQWSAAEVYLVDPGKHISVLCEDGYQQKAVYFHYNEEKKTWYRVAHLEDKHGKGVPAVVIKD